jgi:hypothetical protein
MSDPTGKLDLETHVRVFAERVVPRSALPETTPQARPHAIVLAGQLGAGRRNLIVDTTLGNADSAIKNIKSLQAKSYSVEARHSTRQVRADDSHQH